MGDAQLGEAPKLCAATAAARASWAEPLRVQSPGAEAAGTPCGTLQRTVGDAQLGGVPKLRAADAIGRGCASIVGGATASIKKN